MKHLLAIPWQEIEIGVIFAALALGLIAHPVQIVRT